MRTYAERLRLFQANENLAGFARADWMKRNTGAVERWHLERDDLHSIALQALWLATEKWNPMRSKFTTFATLLIWSRLALVVQTQAKKKRGGLDAPETYTFEAPVPGTKSLLLEDVLPGPREREPERALLAGVRCEPLWRAVDSLPEGQRVAIRLCYAEGLSPDAAAARLGVSRQAVCQRVQKALPRLRETCAGLDLR